MIHLLHQGDAESSPDVSSPGTNITVDVYYESLCPDSRYCDKDDTRKDDIFSLLLRFFLEQCLLLYAPTQLQLIESILMANEHGAKQI